MAAYLVDNPPRRSQYRRPRRAAPSGLIVVHTAESTPDTIATDGGAEAVARFIRNRSDPGSYHDLVDSDSVLNLVPYDAEAFGDGTGSNPHAYSVSVATTAAWWPLAPKAWREGAVRNAARAARGYAMWLQARSGIVIPARRVTRGESERRVPGFISHAERDPTRRSDPGRAFPWDDFLAFYAGQTQEDDVIGTTRIDDQKGVVRTLFRTFLLRNPNDQAELDYHVLALAREGYEARVVAIVESAEGKAVLAAERKAIGL